MFTSRQSTSPGASLRVAGDFAAVGELHAAGLQFAAHFAAALEMPRHQDQEQIREALPQAQELLGQERLFARMGAAADQDRAPRAAPRAGAAWPAHPAGGARPAWPRRISGCRRCGSASGRQPSSRSLAASASFCAPTPANEAKSGRNRKRKALVAAVGAVRKPGVDQEHRHAHVTGAPEEVGPDFRLDQHDGFGPDGVQRAGDAHAVVDRDSRSC